MTLFCCLGQKDSGLGETLLRFLLASTPKKPAPKKSQRFCRALLGSFGEPVHRQNIIDFNAFATLIHKTKKLPGSNVALTSSLEQQFVVISNQFSVTKFNDGFGLLLFCMGVVRMQQYYDNSIYSMIVLF